jgi:hypothetical protein
MLLYLKRKILIGIQPHSIIVKMVKAQYLTIAIAFIVIAIGTAALILGFSLCIPPTPINTSIPLLDGEVSSLGEEDMNVIQGSALQINVTLTSKSDQELTIPIEGLKIAAFNDIEWDTSIKPQNKVLNYTFGASQLVLQPHKSNSTVLTVYMAEDASVGQYALAIALGNGQVTDFYGIGLIVRVMPKLE